MVQNKQQAIEANFVSYLLTDIKELVQSSEKMPPKLKS